MREGQLVVVAERKFSDFFKKPNRFEASDVVYMDGFLYVVFDNLYQVARIRVDLDPKKNGNKFFGEARDEDSGYEGITFNRKSNRFYALVECAEYPDLSYRAQVHEYDRSFERRTGGWWLDFKFGENSNKGFEGLTWLVRDGKEYLLALCEGNSCAGGEQGEKPGNGRIQVFEKNDNYWEHVSVLAIPSGVRFVDYAGLGLSGNRVLVTSQECSSLWIGKLKDRKWTFEDEGMICHFPTKEGKTIYCNLEGVCEIPGQNNEIRLAVVSDKRKKSKKKKRGSSKDQSIHVFVVS